MAPLMIHTSNVSMPRRATAAVALPEANDFRSPHPFSFRVDPNSGPSISPRINGRDQFLFPINTSSPFPSLTLHSPILLLSSSLSRPSSSDHRPSFLLRFYLVSIPVSSFLLSFYFAMSESTLLPPVLILRGSLGYEYAELSLSESTLKPSPIRTFNQKSPKSNKPLLSSQAAGSSTSRAKGKGKRLSSSTITTRALDDQWYSSLSCTLKPSASDELRDSVFSLSLTL